jgi:HD-like signal output (HDOD) protein
MGARYCAVNAFIGGLLHDLGQLIFIENFTAQYRKVYQQAKATNQDLHQVEKTVFGTTTAEVSSFLLELWA